jgi:glycerol-1-phosphate dehydrogenase [NAD(P)+]
MARLQAEILARESPPTVAPTIVDEKAMLARYGPRLGPLCIAEMRKTALDAADADALNARLAELWPTLRPELRAMAMPVAAMEAALKAAGGPTTAEELGLPRHLWHDAIRFSREIRGRWSFVNLAADAGLLDDLLEGER